MRSHVTSTPTQQDLLNKELQKLARKHISLEVHQREDIRRYFAEGMKFGPPHFEGRRTSV